MPPVAATRTPRELAIEIAWNLLLIAVGSTISAAAINGILIPYRFVSGGITGFVLIVNRFLPEIPFGALYLVANIPFYLLAYRSVGKRFFFYSLAGLAIYTAAVSLVKIEIQVSNPILAALLGGMLFGAGGGTILRSYGSAGGLDIFSIVLLKRFSISLGNTVLAVNTLIVITVGVLFSLEAVLYTLIFIYVSSRVVDLVVTGLSQRKSVFIISKEWERINREILRDIRRGVTVLEGKGGYSGQQEHILYTVITFRELGQLKRAIQIIDPDAFVVVSDTLEVMNYRIGNQPHW